MVAAMVPLARLVRTALAAVIGLSSACGSQPEAPAKPDGPAAPGPVPPGDGGTKADGSVSPPGADAGDEAPWTAGLEQCGNGTDDDGDGLVDEDCGASLFVGVFPPGGSGDLAGGGHVARMEADLGRKLSVLQTYRSTTAVGAARAKEELAAIWKHGLVAHLYFEPGGYTPAQYAAAATDPTIVADLALSAKAVAEALAANATGRLLLSFGAEMNGNWTDWGCKNTSAATFIAMSRKMHGAVAAALDVRKIDRRRVRWVYAPNSTSSGGCGTPADYYPGHDATDLLGASAYRSGTQSVEAAVIAPTKQLLSDLAYPPAWQRDRFVVLQTGSRTITGDDRGAWLKSMVERLAADPAYVGVIPFDLSHATDGERDWALLDTAKPPVARSGYGAFISAAAALPASDRALEGTFDPYFWDVGPSDAAYPEIQALRGAGITGGCRAAPPLFCPSVSITRAEAAALLAAAFGVTAPDAAARIIEPCRASSPCPAEPIRRDTLGSAVASLLQAKRPEATKDLARLQAAAAIEPSRDATRAEASVLIVHAARIAPAPRP